MNERLLKSINNPFLFAWFLLIKLPMGLLAGLKLVEATPKHAIVMVKYQYVTKNPFHSIYFGCLAMAAELASGALGLVYSMNLKPEVSMLVVRIEAEFMKKGRGRIHFICEDGEILGKAAKETRETGEPRTVTATSIGRDVQGRIIAKFLITWSFKAKVKNAKECAAEA